MNMLSAIERVGAQLGSQIAATGLDGLATPLRLGAELAQQAAQAIPGGERANWGARGGSTPAAPTSAPAAAAGSARTGPTPDAITLARLSEDVYADSPAPPAGWHSATQADLDRLGLSAGDLSSNSSAFRARVYVSGSGADTQYVVSFRGTATKGDWKADIEQAAGISTDHYRHALLIGERIARSGAPNVTMTGHSLGGGLASAAALASGQPAATFNAAGLSGATIDAANTIRAAAGAGGVPDVRAYYVRGEVLSAIQDGGDRLIGGLLFGLPGLAIDAPEAFGTRIPLDAVRPAGVAWYQDNPIARHAMDWVLASLQH